MNTFMAGIQEMVDRPHTPGFLDNLFRSRMMGACGIGLNGLASARASLWSAEVKAAARRNFDNFKKYRHLFGGDMHRLTPQPRLYWPDLDPPSGWEAMEYVNRNGTEAACLCFRGASSDSQFRVRPRGLTANRSYQVTSLNTGRAQSIQGAAATSDVFRWKSPNNSPPRFYYSELRERRRD